MSVPVSGPTALHLLGKALHTGALLSHHYSPLGPHLSAALGGSFETCMRGSCPEWRNLIVEATPVLSQAGTPARPAPAP